MDRQLSLEEMGEAAYLIASGNNDAFIATYYGLTLDGFTEQYIRYWARWHELRRIEGTQSFTPDQRTEYEKISATVQRIDVREAARCKKAIQPALKLHGRTIGMLHRLAQSLEQNVGKQERR